MFDQLADIFTLAERRQSNAKSPNSIEEILPERFLFQHFGNVAMRSRDETKIEEDRSPCRIDNKRRAALLAPTRAPSLENRKTPV